MWNPQSSDSWYIFWYFFWVHILVLQRNSWLETNKKSELFIFHCRIFGFFDDDHLQVTLEEFIDGILRCKGPARAIDQANVGLDCLVPLIFPHVL